MKQRRLSTIFVVYIVITLFTAVNLNAIPKKTQTDKAWIAWQQGQIESAERLFREELQSNPLSLSALTGLFEFLTYRRKSEEAIALLPDIVKAGDDAYPFLYAAWNDISLVDKYLKPIDEVIEIVKSLTKPNDADKQGTLRALALEKLGNYFLQNGDTTNAAAAFANLGVIERWSVIGPFDNISGSGFEKIFPPESSFNPSRIYSGKENIPAQWFDIPEIRRDKWIDFEYYYGVTSDIYYANCFVYSSIKQNAEFRLGASGSIKAFLNDALIINDEDEKNSGYDSYIQAVELNAGWNRILVKIGNSEIERNNFAVRITNKAGIPIDGLKYDTAPKNYTSAPESAHPSPLENYAEQFYRALHSKNSSDPLPTMLLASSYLLNDKHIEAEELLLDALKTRPNAPFYMSLLIEAYSRSKKTDELQSLRDKLNKIDSLNSNGIISKFNEEVQNENYDAAESAARKYDRIYPDSPIALALRIQLYGKKSQSQEYNAAVEDAFKRFPNIWEFANAFSSSVMERTHNKDSAASIMERALSHNVSAENLWSIASLYLSYSDIPKWTEFADKALKMLPVAAGYFQVMANQYLTMQNPEMAARFAVKALALSPQSGVIHQTYARILRALNDSAKAASEFQTAIKFNPVDFDSRAELRAYQGKPSLYSRFESVNTDSIIRHAPNVADYPDKDYAIVLEEQKRIIYDNGASEYTTEIIARLFTVDGVDKWKEYTLAANSATDDYTIEKAVSIKPDGAEINADVSGDDIVFKSLEPGDIVRVRWRIRAYNGGRFANKFWDSYILDGNVPIKYIRIAILAADSLKFNFRVRNSNLKPTIRRTEDGAIYEWTLRNQAGVEDELAMPSWYEAGKNLEFSSIHSWSEIVQWYLELTRSQIKSTREVREQARILRDSLGGGATKRDQIRAIYDYITKNIRYSSVPFRQSAFIPQKANATLTTKIGDCKDLATLFIAMAAEFGVKARYVLVNTFDLGYSRQNPLPSPWAFDHCIAAAEIGDELIYIDLTAPDFAVGSAPDNIIGAFALLIKEGVSDPISLDKKFFSPNNLYRSANIELNANGKSRFNVTSERSGWLAAGMRNAYRDKSQKDREKILGESLSQDYQNVEIINFAFNNFEDSQKNLNYTADFTVSDLMSEAGSFYVLKIPWSEYWTPSPAFTLDKREFPLVFPNDADTIRETLTLRFPPNTVLMETPKSIKKSSAAGDYSAQYSYADRILKAERTLIRKKSFIATDEYPALKSMYNAVVKEDARQLLLKSSE